MTMHDAERLARDIAAGSRLSSGGDVGLERLFGDADHGADALLDAALLAAIADGPAHLPGELRRDVVVHGEQRIEEGAACSRPRSAMGTLRHSASAVARRRDGRRDLGIAGNRPLGIDRAIDGRDDHVTVSGIASFQTLTTARNRASIPNR